MTQSIPIKPHHLLDIIRDIGAGREHTPHRLGHDVHRIAELVRSKQPVRFSFTEGDDAICAPCSRLYGHICTDTTDTVGFLVEKDAYNRAIDRRLMKRLGITENGEMSLEDFCNTVREKLGDITSIYLEVDPAQTAARAENIRRGLDILNGPCC